MDREQLKQSLGDVLENPEAASVIKELVEMLNKVNR